MGSQHSEIIMNFLSLIYSKSRLIYTYKKKEKAKNGQDKPASSLQQTLTF